MNVMRKATSSNEPTMQLTIVMTKLRLLFDLPGAGTVVADAEGEAEEVCCPAVACAFAELMICTAEPAASMKSPRGFTVGVAACAWTPEALDRTNAIEMTCRNDIF